MKKNKLHIFKQAALNSLVSASCEVKYMLRVVINYQIRIRKFNGM